MVGGHANGGRVEGGYASSATSKAAGQQKGEQQVQQQSQQQEEGEEAEGMEDEDDDGSSGWLLEWTQMAMEWTQSQLTTDEVVIDEMATDEMATGGGQEAAVAMEEEATGEAAVEAAAATAGAVEDARPSTRLGKRSAVARGPAAMDVRQAPPSKSEKMRRIGSQRALANIADFLRAPPEAAGTDPREASETPVSEGASSGRVARGRATSEQAGYRFLAVSLYGESLIKLGRLPTPGLAALCVARNERVRRMPAVAAAEDAINALSCDRPSVPPPLPPGPKKGEGRGNEGEGRGNESAGPMAAERILDYNKQPGHAARWLVKWKRRPSTKATWEPRRRIPADLIARKMPPRAPPTTPITHPTHISACKGVST